MNEKTRRSATAMALLGTASFLTIAGTAAAQTQDNQPIEEVLVTGTLIHGIPAVGVPITAISDQDFKEAGGQTISDVLKESPSINVLSVNSVGQNAGSAIHVQSVNIHGLFNATATESLLMINGIRFPPQGLGWDSVDPSIVATIAVDHVDILADGASATYGSDALGGVVNVILRRGFEGAITQLQYGRSTGITGGAPSYQADQLYGSKWSSGDITVSYDWYRTSNVPGPGRPYFTLNYEPFGFDDVTPIGASMPGVVSTGGLVTDPNVGGGGGGFSANTGTRACLNCYSIPNGTGWNYGDTPAHTNPTAPGSAPTTNWTTLLANQGVKNEKNPDIYADVIPSEERNAATITFDQDLSYGVSVFADAFYSNRYSVQQQNPGVGLDAEQALRAVAVPTTNPYYPAGAPAGLRVSYDLAVEHNTRLSTGETAGSYRFGFNAKLPFDWHGKLYYSMTSEKAWESTPNRVSSAMVNAALGNTVAAAPANGITPPQAAFTKPANIPFLNLFCDASVFQCNAQSTMNYITGYRFYNLSWQIAESGLNFDGPLFDLPGGPLKAAVGLTTYSNHNLFHQISNFNNVNTSVVTNLVDPSKYFAWATYAEFNVPVIGEANKIPLVQAFNIELDGRFDRYTTFGKVWTPKVAADWDVGWGLRFRGNWSRGFRAPIPAETSAVNGGLIQPLNVSAGASAQSITLNCNPVPGQPNSPTAANPGSLNAALNPTCGAAASNPGGIDVEGGSGVAAPLRIGTGLGPEKSVSWGAGFEFAPTGYFSGLDVGATWYNLRIDGSIGSFQPDPNDPLGKVCTAPGTGCTWFVPANPNLPITDPSNAVFASMVAALSASPRSTLIAASQTNIQFINDRASANLGYGQVGGIDFNARYDFNLADWGAWNVGILGNYVLLNKTQAAPGLAAVNFFQGQNNGGRLKYRGRLGWASMDGLSVTGFVNFISHSANSQSARFVPPKCYWQQGFSAGSCYPGSPFFGPFPAGHFPAEVPGLFTFDLSLAYQTGTRTANEYLHNINFQLTVNDILDKAPPYLRNTNQGIAAVVGGIATSGAGISPLQRVVSFEVTKAW